MVEIDWKTFMGVKPENMSEKDKENLHESVTQYKPDYNLDRKYLIHFIRVMQEILKYKAAQVDLLTNELDELAASQGREEGTKLQQYLEEIEQLKDELEYYRKLDKSSSRSTSNEELKREIVRLEMQNEELLNELNEKDKELLNEKEEVEKYVAQVAALEREKLELSRELRAIHDEEKSIGSVKDSPEISAERQQLTEAIRQKNRHISQLLEDIDMIEEENQSLRAKLTGVKDELSETTTHITDITAELAKLRHMNEDYQSKLSDSEERIKSLLCQIEELVEGKANHDKQLDEYIAMFNTKLQEWKDEIEAKNEEIMQLKEEMKKLSSPRFTSTNEQDLHVRIMQQEREIEVLQSELQKATEEINSSAELIEKLKEKQLKLISQPTNTQSIKFLEEKIKVLEEKLAYAEEDANVKAEEMSYVIIQLREYESGVFGLPEAVTKIKKLEKHIKERDLQIEKLVEICNHLEIKLDAFEEQNLCLREKLGLSASDEIDTSGVKLRYRKDEEMMENLKLQLDRKEEELIKAKLKYRKAIKFLKITPPEEKLDGEVEQLNEKLVALIKENDALRKGMHEILESVRKSSGRVEVQSACLERLLEALDSRHVSGWYHPAMRLQAQLNTEEGKNEELRNQIRSLRTEEKKRVSELQNALLKIQSLEQDLSTPRYEEQKEPKEPEEPESEKHPIVEERNVIEVESTLMEMKLELDRRELAMQNLQIAFNTEKENLLTKITELESQNKQLKTDNPELGQISELTSRIVVLERQLNYLKTSETTIKQDNDRLKLEIIKQEEKMLQDILKLQNDKSKLISKIEDLEKVIVDTIPRSKYNSLANDLANIRSKYQNAVSVSLVGEDDSRNNLQVEVSLLQSEKQSILEELKTAKEKLTIAEGLISENVVTKGDFSNEIAVVAGKLAASEVRELNERQKSAHVEKLNSILQAQLQEVETRNKELLRQVTKLTTEVERHQEVERSLRMRVLNRLTEEDEESLRNKLHILEKRCEELKTEKDNVQELFEISQGQCRALQEWKDSDKILMNSLNEQILLLQSSEDDKAKISRLSHELAMTKITISQLSKQNNDLRLKITKTLSHNVTLEMKLEENRKEFRKEQEKHLSLTEYLYESLDEIRNLYGSTTPFQNTEAIYATKMELKQKERELTEKLKEVNAQIQEYSEKKEEMETQLESLGDLQRAIKGDTKNLIAWHNKATELRLKEAKYRRQNEYLLGEISQLEKCMKKLNDEIASLEEGNVEKEKDWERKQILWEKAQLHMCKLLEGKGIKRQTKDSYTVTEEISYKEQTNEWRMREMEAELSKLRKDSKEKDEIIMMKDKLLMNINGKAKTIELEETVCAEKIENAEKEALKVTVQSLQNIIKQKEETILKYQDLLKEAREEYGRACAKLQDELRDMNDTLTAQSKAYSKLKNAVQTNNMSESVSVVVEKYMMKIHELEEELRECEMNLSSMNMQACRYQQEADKWKNIAEERQSMIKELKQRLEYEEKDKADKEEVKKYQKEIERLNQFIDLLRNDRRLSENTQVQEEKPIRLKSDQLSDCTFDKPQRKEKEVESLKRQLKFSKEESARLREQIRLLQTRKRPKTTGSFTTRSDSKTSVREESLTSKIKHLEELLTMSKEREKELMDINLKKLKSTEEVAKWEERKKSQQTIQTLSGKLKEKEAEVEVLKNKNESFRKMIYKCERDKNILEAQLKAAKDGPEGTKARVEKLLQEKKLLEAEVASLQARLEEQVRHSTGLGAALLQEKLEEQERRLASFELASKGHGAILEELNRLKSTNSNLEKANLRLESENLALQLKLEKEKEEVKDLLHRAKHCQEATEEIKRHEIERTIAHLHKTIDRLSEENKRLRTLQPRSSQTVEKVRKDLAKVREDYEILQGKYSEAIDRNIALEDKLKACQYQIHLMEEKDLAEVLSRTEKIQATVELNQELAEVKTKLSQKTELLNRVKALLMKAAAKEKALLQRVRHLQSLVPDAEAGEDGWRPSKELFVNPDSPIRLIYLYIQQTFEIDCDLGWDLCDESGTLVYMYDKEPWMNGLNYLVPKSTYMVVLFERDMENRLTNPMLYLHESVKRSSNQWSELMAKIRKQINPGPMGKVSRMSKSRSNTSYAK